MVVQHNLSNPDMVDAAVIQDAKLPVPAAVLNPEWEKLVTQIKVDNSIKKPRKSKKEVGVSVSLAPRR